MITDYSWLCCVVSDYMLLCLFTGFPPIFKDKIKDKAYNVGDSCTLRVHVIGNPPPIVSWYRNEEILSTGQYTRQEVNIHVTRSVNTSRG